MKLNFGCGDNRLPGWRNFDADVDIGVARLPFDSECADFIFAEHVVEHVPYKRAINFFDQCWRVLKYGGVIRIAVPSLENVWHRADQPYCDFTAKFQPPATVRGAMRSLIDCHGHECGWTSALLSASLYACGFDQVAACNPHASKHAELRNIEGHGRIIGASFNWIETAICEATKVR